MAVTLYQNQKAGNMFEPQVITDCVTAATQSQNTPLIAHKFRALNAFFWKNLAASTVYFPAPHEMNDPYDCQIDLMKAVHLAKASEMQLTATGLENWKPFVRSVTERAAKCGIFSLFIGDLASKESTPPLNESCLLWAHYADNHRGVCVTYEIPHDFVYRTVGWNFVKYGDRQLLDAIRNLDNLEIGTLDLSNPQEFEKVAPVIINFLITKATPWAYEKEFRILWNASGLVQFKRDWLRQVCFGLKTSKADRSAVIEAVDRLGYKNCSIAEVFSAEGGLYDLNIRLVR